MKNKRIDKIKDRLASEFGYTTVDGKTEYGANDDAIVELVCEIYEQRHQKLEGLVDRLADCDLDKADGNECELWQEDAIELKLERESFGKDSDYCDGCGMIYYNCLCGHE